MAYIESQLLPGERIVARADFGGDNVPIDSEAGMDIAPHVGAATEQGRGGERRSVTDGLSPNTDSCGATMPLLR